MKHSFLQICILPLLFIYLTGCTIAPTIGGDITPAGGVLFKDNFEDPASGWLQGEDESGKTEYIDGSFRIFVNSEATWKLSIPRLYFTDVIIEVDATKISGPDDNDFGVICRYQDENNFYFFEISSDGYYSIGKFKDNQHQLIGMQQMQTSDNIHQGPATNRIQATCEQSSLSLSVNGQLLVSVEDSDFSVGDVGLIAGTFGTPGTEILFDNFIVYKP